MCGFQSPGHGFFFIPDCGYNKQGGEKRSSVVVTILEGSTSVKDIETEFNGFFSQKPKKWRCAAREISPSQFVMRFPNACEIERASYYGKRLPILDGAMVVSISPWSSSLGAKEDLQKDWVHVRNVPLEKRYPKYVSYASGLVGVTLEVNPATIHKREYARILLDCREVDKIPAFAKGMLEGKFYDFFYEVEKVVVGALEKTKSHVPRDSSASPSVN
ncbi:hypothetical protein D1007_50877 [Hordeum vulgare]|nr:hypothetical protein D1007_50877 [Hordeum vulgare]